MTATLDPTPTGVLLAAGAGGRHGGPKALRRGEDGLPWVLSTARTLLAGGCGDVVVCVGASASRVREALTDEPGTGSSRSPTGTGARVHRSGPG